MTRKKNKYRVSIPKSDEGARALEFLKYYHELREEVGQLNARIDSGAPAEDIQKELR